MAWKRIMAVGCSHGDLCHPVIREQVLEFKRRFNPHYRMELGDLIDTACFRNGAAGTKDEARSPRDDRSAALRWIAEYEPTHIAWGNHDWRLHELKDHPKAIIATLAGDMWDELEAAARNVKAKTVPYDIKYGWHHLAGYDWGHGYMYNQWALRDHAEMNGSPTVMAHLHYAHSVEGRTRKDTPSFCAGALADDTKLIYGRRRRACLNHNHGLVYGEVDVSGDRADLHLLRSEQGEPLRIPSWI